MQHYPCQWNSELTGAARLPAGYVGHRDVKVVITRHADEVKNKIENKFFSIYAVSRWPVADQGCQNTNKSKEQADLLDTIKESEEFTQFKL